MKIFIALCLACMLIRYSYIIYEEYNSFNVCTVGFSTLKSVKMKFEQWKDLYALNPNRYNLDKIINEKDAHLFFLDTKHRNSWDNATEKILISFSFIDYIKFLFFLNECKGEKEKEVKNNSNIEENEALKHILEVAQLDIEKIKEQSQKEIEKAKEVMNESNTLGRVSPSMIKALEYELQKNKYK